MSSVTDTPKPIGRPREQRADRAILTATLELIAARGTADLRIDDVADRAHVGKATIYRRYASKQELIAAALKSLVTDIAIPDTGSTEEDLRQLMRNAVRVYRGSVEATVMPAVVDAISRDPKLARSVREGFLERRRAALSVVLERGVQRGDLRPDLDFELALDVLGGPLFYRLLVTGGPIDKDLADGVAELMIRGFAPAKDAPARRRRRK